MGRVGAGETGNHGTQNQEEDAYPPYQESYVYVHHNNNNNNNNNNNEQPAAFPPPPEKAHAFPPPQEPDHHHHQTPAAFPPNQPTPQHMPQFNGGNMHGGMGIPMNMPPPGSPFNNPTFQPTPQMVMQPNPNHHMMPMNMEPWKSSLFDCFDDPENALITACVPCVSFGQIAEIVDQGQSSCATSGCLYTLIACCTAMPCLLSCSYRTKLRSRFMLVEAPGSDCIIHCFCHYCALCQEYRELKRRGYDPAIGWAGNAARMGMNAGSIAMTPPVQPTMMGR